MKIMQTLYVRRIFKELKLDDEFCENSVSDIQCRNFAKIIHFKAYKIYFELFSLNSEHVQACLKML